jgi:hypothetical protein
MIHSHVENKRSGMKNAALASNRHVESGQEFWCATYYKGMTQAGGLIPERPPGRMHDGLLAICDDEK